MYVNLLWELLTVCVTRSVLEMSDLIACFIYKSTNLNPNRYLLSKCTGRVLPTASEPFSLSAMYL